MKSDKISILTRIKMVIAFCASMVFSLMFWIFWAINELSSKAMDFIQDVVTKMFNWAQE